MKDLLIVSGLLCTDTMFHRQVEALQGIANITFGNHQRYNSVAEIATGILADAPDTFCLTGFSFGGYISFEIMRQAPERVERLALIGTSAPLDKADRTKTRLEQIRLAQAGEYDKVCDILVTRFINEESAKNPEIVKLIREAMTSTGPEIFCQQMKNIMGRSDSTDTLATIKCPTVMIVGEEDALAPKAKAQTICDGINGCKLVIIPNSGHLVPLEQPEQVNAALIEWLNG